MQIESVSNMGKYRKSVLRLIGGTALGLFRTVKKTNTITPIDEK